MSKGIDRTIAYRTMRAVELQRHENAWTPPPRPPTTWERWKAAVTRLADRLTGVR